MKYKINYELIDSAKKKICIIIFGFVPRSFRFTYQSIINNIINPLKSNYDVKVYHYALLSRSKKIESKRKEESNDIILNNDYNLINCDKIIYEYQEDIDLKIIECKSSFYDEITLKNLSRYLYQEAQCIKHFPINNFDACVMINNEEMYINKINFDEINKAITRNCCFTKSFSRYGGTSDGFYICKPSILNIICNRYNEIILGNNKYCGNSNGRINTSEAILKITLDKNNIDDLDSNIFCLKVRSNGKFSNSGLDGKLVEKIGIYVSLDKKNELLKKYWD